MTPSISSHPLLTVVGAANKQGRSVAESLLDSGCCRCDDMTSEAVQHFLRKGTDAS